MVPPATVAMMGLPRAQPAGKPQIMGRGDTRNPMKGGFTRQFQRNEGREIAPVLHCAVT